MILILKAFDVSFSILRASPEFWHDVFRPNRCWGWLDLPCCLAEVGTCFKASRCNWLELVYQADHISSIHLDWIGWRGSERWFQPVFMKGRTVLFANLLKRERPKLNKHPSPKDLKSLQDQLTTWVPGESLYVKNRAFVTESWGFCNPKITPGRILQPNRPLIPKLGNPLRSGKTWENTRICTTSVCIGHHRTSFSPLGSL